MTQGFSDAAVLETEIQAHMLNCDLNIADLKVADEAMHAGEIELAQSIKLEVAERTRRCLGGVMCGDRLECGVLHGNVKES